MSSGYPSCVYLVAARERTHHPPTAGRGHGTRTAGNRCATILYGFLTYSYLFPDAPKIDPLMTGSRRTEKSYHFRERALTGSVPSDWPVARPENPTFRDVWSLRVEQAADAQA
jgi:hypothetical protein